LRIFDIRKEKSKEVVDYRGRKDAYTDEFLPLSFTRFELDHVVELQQARDAFDSIAPQGTNFSFRMKIAKEDVKNACNIVENFNMTSCETNQLKFQAIYAFQEDYKTGERQLENGLIQYLLDAHSPMFPEKRGLPRDVSRRIQQVLFDSSDAIIDELQDENPLHEKVIDYLIRNRTAMKLL